MWEVTILGVMIFLATRMAVAFKGCGTTMVSCGLPVNGLVTLTIVTLA